MKNLKRILIFTLILMLFSISSVCASDVNDTTIASEDTNQVIEEVNDDVIESENQNDILESADEDIVSMNVDSWFYDDVVWYDGDYEEADSVYIVFADDLQNSEKITIQLCHDANSEVIYDDENPEEFTIHYSDYKNPIANVDLAILNDYNHEITKLTTNSKGFAVYNIPFDTEEFSVCVGFWYDESHVAGYANLGETTITGVNWGTWNKGNCINGAGENIDITPDDSDLNVGDDSSSVASDSKSYNVSSIYEWNSALSSNRYENVIINLKSDITTDHDIICPYLDQSIKKFTIEGNGKTFDADGLIFLHIDHDAEVTIRNIRVINGWASYGGAIFNDGAGKLTVVNSVFEDNHALRSGGVIYNSGHNSIIKNCTFRNNYASRGLDSTGMIILGGAIYDNADNVTIRDNIFESNYVTTTAYRIDDTTIQGGAIYIAGDNAKITGNIFIENSADDKAMVDEYNSKGGAISVSGDNVKIKSNTFINNSAGNGAAIYTYGSNVLIDSNTFKLNNAFSSNRYEPIIYMYRGGYYADVDESDNIFVTNTQCYSTIFHFAYSGAVITNNVFNDRLDTIIETSPNKTFSSEYDVNNYLVVTLKDETGEVLKGIPLQIDFNGVSHLTTDGNGQIKLSTNGMSPNVYNAKITFSGDDNYAESTITVNVTVEKPTQESDSGKSNTTNPENNNNQNNNQNTNNTNTNLKPKTKKATKITAKKATFKAKAKTKKYTITLKSGKKALKKVKVYLKIKGKTYTAKTNNKGKAIFKIKNLKKKGTYKAKITFKGNKNYNKISKTVKIKIK